MKRKLPEDIEEQILEYLHLEYGEYASDPEALKLSELKYVGQKEIDGKQLHCWDFPSENNDIWATVEYSDTTFNLSFACKPEIKNENRYEFLLVSVLGKEKSEVKIPLDEDRQYGGRYTRKTHDVLLENGETLKVLSAEVAPYDEMVVICVQIEYLDQSYQTAGGSFLEFELSLNDELFVTFEIWDKIKGGVGYENVAPSL